MYLEYAKHIGADSFVQEWVNTTLKNYLLKNKPETEEVEHILDYMVQSGKRVSKMSYAQALKLADAWTKAEQKKGKDIIELESDTETILDFGDGFKIVKLVGENAYKREGHLMRHCVGSYYGKNVEIYSLRDKDNMPHCTMEKDQQIKGKGNGDIHPKYISYVVQFLEKVGMAVGDSEMKHLGYVNIEELIPELHEDTKKLLYNGKYYPTQSGPEKLIDKEGNQYLGMDVLDYFPMFTEEETETSFKLKLNFDFSLIAEYHRKIVKKAVSGFNLLKSGVIKGGDNAKISADDNATVSAEDYATVSAGYNAKVSAGYNAKVSAGNNAKVSAGYNAKISAGNYATVSAGNNATVSAEDYAKISAGNYATVSAGNNAKVSAGNNAKISAGNYATVSAGNNATVSAEDYAKISAGNYATVSAGNNATVSAGYNAKISAGNYATVSAGYNAKVSAGYNAKVSALKHSILVAETDSKLSGGMGSILLLTKREWIVGEYKITDWKAGMVDGKKIKENVFYRLENGEFVEVV